MQWLIDLVAERVIATIGIPPVFIDRGDPVSYDYTSLFWTADSTWHELDLSGIVPTGAKAIAVNFLATHILVQKLAMFRRHGQVNFVNSSRLYTQVAGSLISFDIIIPVDADRKIDYAFEPGPWLVANFVVKGWWL